MIEMPATSSPGVPRDRNGTFTPQPVPQRITAARWPRINMDAGRMTLRNAPHHLGSAIGTVLCHEAISKITEQVPAEVTAAALMLYPVIYLGGLVVKVKDSAHVRNRPPTSVWLCTWTNQACARNQGANQRRRVLGCGGRRAGSPASRMG